MNHYQIKYSKKIFLFQVRKKIFFLFHQADKYDMQMCIVYPKYSKFSRGNKKLPIKGPIKVATLLNRYHIKDSKKKFFFD